MGELNSSIGATDNLKEKADTLPYEATNATAESAYAGGAKTADKKESTDFAGELTDSNKGTGTDRNKSKEPEKSVYADTAYNGTYENNYDAVYEEDNLDFCTLENGSDELPEAEQAEEGTISAYGSEEAGDNTYGIPLSEDGQISYEQLAIQDLAELKESFPELRSIQSVAALPCALRYAELRDLGLSAKEAYLATGRIAGRQDNRSHLHSSVPKGVAGAGTSMKPSELSAARELFTSLSDADIQRLFKRVTGQNR